MSDDKNARYRFTVPLADSKVLKWIESQSNLGFSLRVLIKAAISQCGYQDVTCIEFGSEVKKRGRPSKAMTQYSEQDAGFNLFGTNTSEEDEEEVATETGQVTEIPKVPEKTEEKGSKEEDDDGFVDPDTFFNN